MEENNKQNIDTDPQKERDPIRQSKINEKVAKIIENNEEEFVKEKKDVKKMMTELSSDITKYIKNQTEIQEIITKDYELKGNLTSSINMEDIDQGNIT